MFRLVCVLSVFLANLVFALPGQAEVVDSGAEGFRIKTKLEVSAPSRSVHCAIVDDVASCLEGKLRAQAEVVQLQIELAATRRVEMKDVDGVVRGVDVERLLEIQTDTSLPLNKPVLLGVTPLGEATSVTIIQISPKSG